MAEIKQFAAGGKACVINTLNGDTNVPFFKEYAAAGLTAETCPVVSFSISEDEFRGLPAKQLVGQLGCWTYFESIKSPANKKFVGDFQTWLKTKAPDSVKKEGRVTCSPMVLSYDGVYLWKMAVEKAKSFEVNDVRKALKDGISFEGPGGTVTSQKNMHMTKNVYIGRTTADGQFQILETYKGVKGRSVAEGHLQGDQATAVVRSSQNSIPPRALTTAHQDLWVGGGGFAIGPAPFFFFRSQIFARRPPPLLSSRGSPRVTVRSLFGALALLAPLGTLLGADSARQVIANAIVEEGPEKRVELVNSPSK